MAKFFDEMKKFFSYLNRYRRSFIYSIILGIGLVFSVQVLKDAGGRTFLLVILVICTILVFEIYLNWRYATKVLRQIDMPIINVYNLWGHLLNHITLPLLLTLSVGGFLFFNNDDLIRLVAIALYFVLILILLINIRSYYEDEFKAESVTRYIYEIIKLVIFFFGVNLIIHIQNYWELDLWVGTFLVCILSISLGFLLLYRKSQAEFTQVLYFIVSSIIISVVYMLLNASTIGLLGINVVIFVLFYFVVSILHHKIERTLSLGILVEYILITILAIALFYGLR